jgi:hypothetical protein
MSDLRNISQRRISLTALDPCVVRPVNVRELGHALLREMMCSSQ